MTSYRIDNLQYCNWSEDIFKMNRDAQIDAVHVTIAYHEDFDEVKKNVADWHSLFDEFSSLIFHGKTFHDIEKVLINFDYKLIAIYNSSGNYNLLSDKDLEFDVVYAKKEIYNKNC